MPYLNSRGRAVLVFAILILTPGFLTTGVHAQRTTGDLLGVVRDASGAILPGVSVSVAGPNIVGAQSTTTTENGSYRIGNLPPPFRRVLGRFLGRGLFRCHGGNSLLPEKVSVRGKIGTNPPPTHA